MQDKQMQWAKIGAAVRLEALEQERAAILQAFPEMRRSRMLSLNGVAVGGHGVPSRRFSVAARRRMSAGMRKYWARRKAAAKKASAA
jgi:hypothetical protein